MDELYLTERIGELERTVAKTGDKMLQLEDYVDMLDKKMDAMKKNLLTRIEIIERSEDKKKKTVDHADIHDIYSLWCRIYGANMDGKHWNVKDIKDFAIHYANQVK